MHQMVISRLTYSEALRMKSSLFSTRKEETFQTPTQSATVNEELNIQEPNPIQRKRTAMQSVTENEEGSTVSTADYPMTPGSSIIPAQALRTQISFEESMARWYNQKDKEINDSRRYRYTYGRQNHGGEIFNQILLTPEVKASSSSSKSQKSSTGRQPTASPFKQFFQQKQL